MKKGITGETQWGGERKGRISTRSKHSNPEALKTWGKGERVPKVEKHRLQWKEKGGSFP